MLVLVLSIVLVVLDQVTKELVREGVAFGTTVPVIKSFFNISHVHNRGAAWGMLAGAGHWLIVFSVVMLVVLVVFRRHFLTDTLAHRVASGLMVAGIVGNLLDRVRLGYVVDFLDFHAGVYHFPSFNVADSAICIGVGIYILTQVYASGGPPSGAPAPAGDSAVQGE